MATLEMLRTFLDRLEDAADRAGGRRADLADPELSLYHDALNRRFNVAIAQIHELLGEALMDRGYRIRVGSTFKWVMRQAAVAGLISDEDRDSLCEWVLDRHVTAHHYDPASLNAIIRAVPDFLACGHRVVNTLMGDF